MASSDSFLALVPLSPKEPNLTWEEVCSDPMKLFEEFARRFVVDAKSFKSLVLAVKNDNVPEPSDRSKIWIKTSWPYGIGIVIDGTYKMDWGLSEYPVDTPFLRKESDMEPLKEFVRQLTSDEIANYGLTNTSGSHKDKMKWFIFEPEDPLS